MKIIKTVRREHGFTAVDNSIFREKGLSLKAKGLYCMMWSLPADWEFSVDGLVSLGIDGKDAVRSAMIELGERGYMERKQRRNPDGSLAGMDYALYDVPLAGNPTTVPLAGFPSTVNPPLLNTKGESTNSITPEENNNGGKKSKRFTIPSVEEVDTYCRERGNSVNAEVFVNFYASKGWMVGKTPMKDWKAAVRTWEQTNNRLNAGAPAPQKVKPLDYD